MHTGAPKDLSLTAERQGLDPSVASNQLYESMGIKLQRANASGPEQSCRELRHSSLAVTTRRSPPLVPRRRSCHQQRPLSPAEALGLGRVCSALHKREPTHPQPRARFLPASQLTSTRLCPPRCTVIHVLSSPPKLASTLPPPLRAFALAFAPAAIPIAL